MVSAPVWLPDWRDVAAYRFERLDRAGFAWEWLRRDPAYREAAGFAGPRENGDADAAAAQWGLVRFEPAEFAAPAARPLWRAANDCEALAADMLMPAEGQGAALPLAQLGHLCTRSDAPGVAHILLCDGWRRLRIDLHGVFDPGPPVPRWRLTGLAIQPQLRSLRRLVSLARSGLFASRLWPCDPRVRRWILALRAHDALVAGEGTRAIAMLLGGEVRGPRWRIADPSLRLRAQRLVALARTLPGPCFAERYLRS